MMASNPLLESPGIKLKSKRPRLSTDYEKCIKCQSAKANEKLQTGMSTSVIKFIQCARLRKDEVFKRIEPDIRNDQSLADTVKWHKSCYSSYTSAENAKYFVEIPQEPVPDQPSTSSIFLRSTASTTNWDLCLVCQQKKCKGEKELTQIATKQVYGTLMQAAEYRGDEQMTARIRDEDLIAIEAKYHRGCYQRYTVIASSSKTTSGEEKAKHEKAFLNLIAEIDHKLVNEGRAYEMSTLLNMYRLHLINAGTLKDDVDLYKVQNLKKRLINKYGEKIAFHKQFERNKAELVCSTSLNLSEIINHVAEIKHSKANASDSYTSYELDTCTQVLYHAAIILRNEMKDAVGIETHPLNLPDLTMEKAKELVPSKLQLFLKWLTQSQRSFDAELSPIEDNDLDSTKCEFTEAEERKVLAIGQDILTCNSGGRKKMPKNVGLGVAVKTMVRGKEIVKMLNHHGHSINYWECEQIETKWAEISLSRFDEGDGYYQAILPSNIEPGTFAQCAADNSDYIEDTIDGKGSVHVMTIAFYQGGFSLDPKELLCDQKTTGKIKQRALKSAETKFYELPIIGKTPAPSIVKKAKTDFFEKCRAEREKIQGLNRAWIFARNTPTKLLEVGIEQSELQQRVPGWTGFHAVVSIHHSIPSRIDFAPMIPAPVTEPNTVYTCLRSLDKTFRETLRQENCVVTFDEGIYCEAKRIQWAVSPELDNIVIRMGGFHRAKNFIGLIGKRMAKSGVEDLWIESDICGSNVASKIISGTHYNRAVRAHKLTLKALERLKWEIFVEWATEKNEVDESIFQNINSKKNTLIDSFQQGYQYVSDKKKRKEVKQQVIDLDNSLSKLNPLYKQFNEEGFKSSCLFAFWNEYMEMVWLLLDFIFGDRDGNWLLHLETFAEMLPYDRAFDHLNYFRWGTVYITDMKRLQETAPVIHNELKENKIHSVATSSRVSSFNRVSPDMALEQTMNRDSKTKGGIVGVSGKQATRDKWALSAHMMAAATTAFKAMSGFSPASTLQKEFGLERLKRDENDVQNIIKCIRTQMTNPFDISECEGEERLPLINIATGTVAPPEVSDSLLGARAQGEKETVEFVKDRLISGNTDFWEPLKKMNIKTFQILNKPIKIGKEKQASKAINIDRRFYSRLLVVCQDRDVDLQEVHSYELAPVPLALANMDGSLRKPNKSTLLQELDMDNNAQTSIPAGRRDQTAYIVDLLAVIQMIAKKNMKTFGELSDTIASTVMAKFHFANQVHIVPDRYDVEDSIKEGERSRRTQWSAMEVKIQGRFTKLPASLKRYLSNGKNKSNLVSFLTLDWLEKLPSQLKDGETLFLASVDGKAMKITNATVERDIVLLNSDHEEANSRMFVHCEYIAKTHNNQLPSPERIIIFSPDTDVAVLCWYHYTELQIKELWFHTGTGRNKRFIPVHRSIHKVGIDVCKLLPAMHALTGCDSTSNLHGIGKRSAFSVLIQHKANLNGLQKLGTDCSSIDDETLKVCLTFIGLLYGEATADLNQLRYKLFTKKQPDSSKLPPTEDSALYHIKRANYQSFIWKHARDRNLALPSPDGNGWMKDEKGSLVPKLIGNDPAPESLLEFVVCRCKKGCHARCSCRKAGLSCTLLCNCSNECENNPDEYDEEAE